MPHVGPAVRPLFGIVAVLCGSPALSAQRTARPTVIAGDDLSEVSLVVVSRQGQIAVWQSQDSRVLRFDTTGKALSSIGRSGEGPGEFRMMSFGGFVGESLWISDPMMRRTTVFGPDGTLLRTQSWGRSMVRGADTVSLVLGIQPMVVLANGDFITGVSLPPNAVRPAWWPVGGTGEQLVRVAPEGTVRQIVSGVPRDLETCRLRSPSGRGSAGIRVPFCPVSASTTLNAVFGGVVLVQQEPDDEDRATVALSLLDFDGRLLWRRQLALDRATVSSRAWEEAVESRRAPPGIPENFRRANEEALSQLKSPRQHYPAVDEVVLGQDGTILLRRGGPVVNGSRQWVVLEHGAASERTIALPTRLKVYDLRGDVAWGVLPDQDDVPAVVSIRLR